MTADPDHNTVCSMGYSRHIPVLCRLGRRRGLHGSRRNFLFRWRKPAGERTALRHWKASGALQVDSSTVVIAGVLLPGITNGGTNGPPGYDDTMRASVRTRENTRNVLAELEVFRVREIRKRHARRARLTIIIAAHRISEHRASLSWSLWVLRNWSTRSLIEFPSLLAEEDTFLHRRTILARNRAISRSV